MRSRLVQRKWERSSMAWAARSKATLLKREESRNQPEATMNKINSLLVAPAWLTT